MTKLKFISQDSREAITKSNYGSPIPVYAKFYKLPEDTLAFVISFHNDQEPWLKNNPIVMENIPVSEYRLEFNNLYRQRIKTIVTLNDSIENTLIISPDSLNKNKYRLNTIAKLKENDTITLIYSGGHMFYEYYKILIQKKGAIIYATLYQLKEINQDREIKEVKTVTLSKSNINDFIRFENEIRKTRENYCSMTSNYVIRSKYLNYRKTGGECTWMGFHFLISSFFYREN